MLEIGRGIFSQQKVENGGNKELLELVHLFFISGYVIELNNFHSWIFGCSKQYTLLIFQMWPCHKLDATKIHVDQREDTEMFSTCLFINRGQVWISRTEANYIVFDEKVFDKRNFLKTRVLPRNVFKTRKTVINCILRVCLFGS